MFFTDGDPGPEIRRKLNEMVDTWEQALVEAVGPQGWAPVVSVVTDGARRVLQITDWTGGEGSKPTVTGFIGATGIVATAALAVDIRGSVGATGPSNTLAIGTVTSAASPSATITGASPNQTLNLMLPKGDKGDTGNTGPANTLTIGTVTTGAASATITGTAPAQVLNLVVPQGIQGIPGNAGWSPIFATAADGARFVLQVTDWAGGAGAKPAVGKYVGATGFVDAIASGVNVRGPAGTGSVSPSGTIAANDLAAFVDSTGNLIKAVKSADLPVSTAAQTALNGKAPLNGVGASGTWPINVTGQSGSFAVIDDRNVVSQPNQVPDRSGVFNFRFKENVGNPPFPASTMYAHVLTVNGWTADGTGGWPTQMSFGERLSYRKGATATTWGAWRQLVDSTSIGEFAPSLTGTGATGNWSINADSATKLAIPRAINGVNFDGTANITVADATKLPLTGGTLTGPISFAGAQTWPTFNQSTTGNAATATKLATARTINGVAFDGTANIAVQVGWTEGVTGKPAVIASGTTQAEARAAIGAGTSSLTLGVTAGTALAGDTVVLPEAPSDGKTYGRKDAGWVEASATPGDNNIGYLNIPQNSQSAAYTCVLTDAGKHILHPAADTTARTFTIPANASVAYPIGTAITFVNQNGTGGIVTIAITTDTMRLAGAGTTGSRTLARNGTATALKITATEWIISGVGLT